MTVRRTCSEAPEMRRGKASATVRLRKGCRFKAQRLFGRASRRLYGIGAAIDGVDQADKNLQLVAAPNKAQNSLFETPAGFIFPIATSALPYGQARNSLSFK
jgi:hypothetical protein